MTAVDVEGRHKSESIVRISWRVEARLWNKTFLLDRNIFATRGYITWESQSLWIKDNVSYARCFRNISKNKII
jgi:hypothetical protein